ncbi:uncharacterized protein EI90DRAFT_3144312 [Cantharellus anzutake]|uniref:uncharacterized protein n=1 Tax=Cantharellus anzutake TaxID=1750568 RepID=UPI0019032966|nr:uncharacterized protein EI90DRAFT_3144312 [Cantharellus anzutake]KAF8337890.1 hypothetical protein EI90DRAFT_3144312 [Cantharellus anzutake]
MSAQGPRFIDIGLNLTDPVFHGIHRGARKHADDFHHVIRRALNAGVKNAVITGGSLSESRSAINLARQLGMYATIGCHPTRSKEFDKYMGGPEAYLSALDNLISKSLEGKGRVVAVGECGLDYDRLHFASPDTQKTHFRAQLALAKKHHLPLFLHSRSAHQDFVKILTEEGFGTDGGRDVGGRGGVVHSFTGTIQEAKDLVAMGFHIRYQFVRLHCSPVLDLIKYLSINGCDGPWCSMTSAHASHSLLKSLPRHLSQLYFPPSCKPERLIEGGTHTVKGRNEPCSIGGVAWVISKLHSSTETEEQETIDRVAEAAWKNTIEVFRLIEEESVVFVMLHQSSKNLIDLLPRRHHDHPASSTQEESRAEKNDNEQSDKIQGNFIKNT